MRQKSQNKKKNKKKTKPSWQALIFDPSMLRQGSALDHASINYCGNGKTWYWDDDSPLAQVYDEVYANLTIDMFRDIIEGGILNVERKR